jgi:hypothetical protein
MVRLGYDANEWHYWCCSHAWSAVISTTTAMSFLNAIKAVFMTHIAYENVSIVFWLSHLHGRLRILAAFGGEFAQL